jgi:hypothetical protein
VFSSGLPLRAIGREDADTSIYPTPDCMNFLLRDWPRPGMQAHRNDPCCFGRRPLASPRWRQLRSQVGVWCEDAVEPGQMRTWRRDQGRELGNEVDGLELDVSRAARPLCGNARCARCAFTRCARSVFHGVLSSYRTLPCAEIDSRFSLIAGRAM